MTTEKPRPYSFDTESDTEANQCIHGLLWHRCTQCMEPWQRNLQAKLLASEPPMPADHRLEVRVTEAQWEELEAILERRQETISEHFRYLLELEFMTTRSLYKDDPF